jgi:heme-degrading monooxygenase HmoA
MRYPSGHPSEEVAMHARMTRLQGPADQIDEGIQQYRDTLSQFADIEGNRGAVLLVDRESGTAVGITLWESEGAVTESRERANQLRGEAADNVGASIEAVEEYEVAVWEVG